VLKNVCIYHLYLLLAFGRTGDLLTAFSLVDEMLTKKYKLKDETFNFLLQACISDKEAGFRHALLVSLNKCMHCSNIFRREMSS